MVLLDVVSRPRAVWNPNSLQGSPTSAAHGLPGCLYHGGLGSGWPRKWMTENKVSIASLRSRLAFPEAFVPHHFTERVARAFSIDTASLGGVLN